MCDREMSLAASAIRRASAMSPGPARPCGFGLASLRRALRRSATPWSGVLPSRTRAAIVGGVEAAQQPLGPGVRVDGDSEHLAADAAVEALHHAVGLR